MPLTADAIQRANATEYGLAYTTLEDLEPVVVGHSLFLNSPDCDAVRALLLQPKRCPPRSFGGG